MFSKLHLPFTSGTDRETTSASSAGAGSGGLFSNLGIPGLQQAWGNAALTSAVGAGSPSPQQAEGAGIGEELDAPTSGAVSAQPKGLQDLLKRSAAGLRAWMTPAEDLGEGGTEGSGWLAGALLESAQSLKRLLDLPAMAPDDTNKGYTYSEVDGDLFVNQLGEQLGVEPEDTFLLKLLKQFGIDLEPFRDDLSDYISPSDVNQGALGDCYFHAAMMALAMKNPGVIEDAIEDLGDGNYAVTFYQGGAPVTVEVSNVFPVNKDGKPVYAQPSTDHPGPRKDLWPLILEAAYAELEGGYGEIEGGSAGATMSLLTGVESDSLAFGESDGLQLGGGLSDEQWNSFAAQAFDRPTVASVRDDLSWWPFVGSKTELSNSDTLFSDHSYVVKEVDLSEGTVTLENPWGTDESTYGGADAEITVTREEFEKYFYRIQFGPAPQSTPTPPGETLT